MARRRSLRLSTRVTLSFGIIALLAGIALTALTYAIARNSLVDQRTEAAEAAAIQNAQEVQRVLSDPIERTSADGMLAGLRIETDGFAFLTDPRVPSRIGFDETSFPIELRQAVANGESARQQFELEGRPYLGVGVHIASHDTAYLEAFPLDDTDDNLRLILTALLVGAGVATLFAAFSGWSTSRRLLRPLSRVADAAGDIASGALGARLASTSDPDIDRLAGSFNEMADAVQTRIEREARFASDVSHELRSPITALSAAVEVLDARRDDLPERSQQALDVVVSQVRRFDDMVIDLLELSRIDAGATDLNTEEINVAELCGKIAHRYGHNGLPIEREAHASPTAVVDRVRFERILANLLENARTHGDGPLRIAIENGTGDGVHVVVEDAGPGVAASERERIFERFARGSAARHRVGTGLGLALVAEHARALNGEAWVEDRPGGGARFVVRVPTVRTR